jgi:hypothetical protein
MYPIRSTNYSHDRFSVYHRRRSLEWHVAESGPLYRLCVPPSERRRNRFTARVIVGIGGGITKVAAPALLHELAHPRLRATMGTMYYGFYHFGGAVSGVMCSMYTPTVPADGSCRLIRTKYGMAMAIALFPPGVWPFGCAHHCHHVSRIAKMVSFQGQSRAS